MDWRYYDCTWCGAVHRTPTETPLGTCPYCGGDLHETEEPRDALWADDTLVTRDALEPGTPQRPIRRDVAHLGAPLGRSMRAVLVRGTPFLVSAPEWTGRADALGVVLHVTDARHLADQVPLTIERTEPSSGTVCLRIAELRATGLGPNFAMALAALTASGRRRSQQLLEDPLTPSITRAVALRVWLADAAQDLPTLLGEHAPAG